MIACRRFVTKVRTVTAVTCRQSVLHYIKAHDLVRRRNGRDAPQPSPKGPFDHEQT